MKYYAKSNTEYVNNEKVVHGTITVLQHCIDVGVMAQYLLKKYYNESLLPFFMKSLNLSENEVIELIGFFAAEHDVGKVHPLFQKNFIENWNYMLKNGLIERTDKLNRIRHEVVSLYILNDFFFEKYGRMIKRNGVFKGFIHAIGNHHEKYVMYNNGRREKISLEEDFWADEQMKMCLEIMKYFPISFNLLDCFSLNEDSADKVSLFFLGLLEFSDWFASGPLKSDYLEFEKYEKDSNIQGYIDEVLKLKIDKLFGEDFKFYDKKLDLSDFSNIFFDVKDISLRPVQKKVAEIVQKEKIKFALIEAPMGEGKTETALYLSGNMAKKKNGISFCLPTGATTTSMYNRIKPIFENQGVNHLNLLHSTSLVYDKLYENVIENSDGFFNSSKTGLFIENTISTVDQVMVSVMKTNFALLRLLALQNKVLIIDEVHAYDCYMRSILDMLLYWCNVSDVPVILLSATLPQKLKVRLVSSYLGEDVELKEKGYPLITYVTENNEVKEESVLGTSMKKNVKINTITLDEDYSLLSKSLKQEIQQGKNVGVICNTVKEAISVYKFLEEEHFNNLVLLHSKFTVEDRKNKEESIITSLGKKNRKEGLIVIGTQVLEQSLDIDFDSMYTMICPIDLLLQRLGRWRRFNIEGRIEDNTFNVMINNVNDMRKNYSGYQIYKEYYLKRTEECLKENSEFNLPIDFRKLLSFVYDSVDFEDDDYVKMFCTEDSDETLGSLQAILRNQGKEAQIVNKVNMNQNTRMGRPQKKVIFVDVVYKNEINKENFLMMTDKKIALEYINKSVAIDYTNLPIGYDTSDNFIECGGLLKGYTICFVNKVSEDYIGIEMTDVETDENGNRYLKKLGYSKKYGYLFEKIKV